MGHNRKEKRALIRSYLGHVSDFIWALAIIEKENLSEVKGALGSRASALLEPTIVSQNGHLTHSDKGTFIKEEKKSAVKRERER